MFDTRAFYDRTPSIEVCLHEHGKFLRCGDVDVVAHRDDALADLGHLHGVTGRAAKCGRVVSVKIHRLPIPFALVEMGSYKETLELAAQGKGSTFGTCVLIHLEQKVDERNAASSASVSWGNYAN